MDWQSPGMFACTQLCQSKAERAESYRLTERAPTGRAQQTCNKWQMARMPFADIFDCVENIQQKQSEYIFISAGVIIFEEIMNFKEILQKIPPKKSQRKEGLPI